MGAISDFIRHHYRHFNGAALVDAADAYVKHLDAGGQMLVTLAGAMSTAELGLSLAEMIRRGKVHAICCTGANLEEDVFNLVAHDHYVRIPQLSRPLARAGRRAARSALEPRHRHLHPRVRGHPPHRRRRARRMAAGGQGGQQFFPHEFMYKILRSGVLEEHYQIDAKDSWLLAAAERDLPMFVPGWEDSTLGNIFAGHCIAGDINNVHTVRTGIEYMMVLADWYQTTCRKGSIGFFQIGGGIAGDFPICVVPMLQQDLQLPDTPRWGYFCQISDSTTSYGSYSGAVPNEKITWGKLSASTPKFIIESDATIVAPLMFAHVLGE